MDFLGIISIIIASMKGIQDKVSKTNNVLANIRINMSTDTKKINLLEQNIIKFINKYLYILVHLKKISGKMLVNLIFEQFLPMTIMTLRKDFLNKISGDSIICPKCSIVILITSQNI